MPHSLRILCLLLAISGIAACGGDEATEATADTATSAAPESEPISSRSGSDAQDLTIPETVGLTETWLGDLDVMTDRRAIRVLTVYSAGRYYLDDGQEKGLVYEMFKRFEDAVNKKLKRGHLRVHVVFIPVARSQLIPALLAGRGDIISAGMTITPGRQQLVDFSKPNSKPVREILVTGPKAPPIKSIDDLSGQELFVRQSSSYRESVDTLNTRFQQAGKEPVTIHPMSELLEDDDLIEMVNTGLLPWAIVDDYKPQLWEGVFDDLVVREDIVFRSEARLGYAFRKNSPKLEAVLNEFLKTHRQGTLLGNVISNRYLRDFDWASNALAQREYQRFENLENIFQTYGEQYGIDYLMVAAQGYQESKLDQSVRSHAGAVGVMQLLPSTAADPNVDIRDIHKVDSNIHAGVRYLNFLRNHYFSDPDITEENRTFLALAAYNAGPSRMINLRNKARKLGYDPNVWFDSVEVIAAKEVGREPVQYVANIYKYYLSYKMSAEQLIRHRAAREAAGIAQ